MRRPRGGAARRLTSSRTWAWLIAGWVAWSLVFLILALAHWPRAGGYNWGAAAAADAAWLTIVLLANALDELQETISNTPEPDRPSHETPGWRQPWAPVAAVMIGVLVGWLAWK